MMIFYEDTEIVRSILAMIASHLALLLKAGKSKCMACSIISPVGALSCSPSSAFVCHEVPSTFRVHQRSCLVPFPVEELMLKSQQVPAPLM